MTIEWSRINGLLGDPAIYAFFPQSGEGVLLDLGSLDALSNRELLKVSTALVSHAHIDHFIGFDRWLRVNIPHGRELEMVGPSGLLANVRGKLAGYCWNLLAPDQLRFIVHELAPDGSVSSFRLCNQDGFEPQSLPPCAPQLAPLDTPLPLRPAAYILTLTDGTRIQAVALDHGTPSVAYLLQGRCRFHTKSEVLQGLNLRPGPWIRALQVAVMEQHLDTALTIDGRSFPVAELAPLILEIKRPKPIGYVTDAGFTPANLDRLRLLLTGVETLICEANYADEHWPKARSKMHLTTRQAALIAACVQAANLEIFHISNLYASHPEERVEEAREFFHHLRSLSTGDLEHAVAVEFAR